MMRSRIRATLMALGLYLAATTSVHANTAGWFEYFLASGSHSGSLAILRSSGKPILIITNPTTSAWQSVGADGSRLASPQRPENLQQLVDAWPEIYGDGTANAIVTVSSGSKTNNFSVNLLRPHLNGKQLIFRGIPLAPLSADLQRLFPKVASNLSTSLGQGSFSTYTLIVGNSSSVPHDVLSAAIQYRPPEINSSFGQAAAAGPQSPDPFDGTPPCTDVITDMKTSRPPSANDGWDASKEIAYITKYTSGRTDLNSLVAPWGSPIKLTDDNLVAVARAALLPCDPVIDLTKPKNNPANVQTVMGILSQSKWDELTTFVGKFEPPAPFEASTFTYQNFLRLVARSPFFCGEPGAFLDVTEACKRDLAMVFAHAAQETGAHEPSSGTPQWQQAFAFIRESGCYANGCSAYNPAPDGTGFNPCPATRTGNNPFVCPVVAETTDPTLQFYGRGIKQLSYFYNYAGFGAQYLGDLNSLLRAPDRVGQDGMLALASGIWFAMAPQPPKPSMHDLITGNGAYLPTAAAGGIALTNTAVRKFNRTTLKFEEAKVNAPVDAFMATISAINGAVECKPAGGSPQAINRISFYYNLLNFLGAKLTSVEAAYGTTNNGCTLNNGDIFGANPSIAYSPYWWIQLPTGGQQCGAVTYGVTVPISIVPEQNWVCVCTPETGKCPPKNFD
jgi:hypothetical protein